MTVAGGDLDIPNAEVDELRWLAPGDATTLLTYARDQALARRLERADWENADSE